MTKPITFKDSSAAFRRSSSGILTEQCANYEPWYLGDVMTPNGIVKIYSATRVTELAIIADGVLYRREWRKGFLPQYLVTLATRFAADVVGGLAWGRAGKPSTKGTP